MDSNNNLLSILIIVLLVVVLILIVYYGTQSHYGPKHHYRSSATKIKSINADKIVFLHCNSAPIVVGYDIYVSTALIAGIKINNAAIKVNSVFDFSNPPGNFITDPITLVQIYNAGSGPGNGAPLAEYNPSPDTFWDDEQMSGSSSNFFVAWNPSSQAIVITDANINTTIEDY